MPKLSVKKPFVVLVAVLALLVLGVTGFTKMSSDFLPEMELPYMVIYTPYPGASPQKVESEVTTPVEDSVSTISGVKKVISTSAENVSQVTLEFENGTNMDGAMVKVTSAVNQLELPDTAGKPTTMEISMDMMATMYVSVDKKGLSGTALTDYVQETVIPQLKRQDGVASVQASGLVKDRVSVRLNQHKVDQVNQRIYDAVNGKLLASKADLDAAQRSLNQAKNKLKREQKNLAKKQAKSNDQMAQYTKQMNQALANQAVYQAQAQTLKAYKETLNRSKEAMKQMNPADPRLQTVQTELNNLDAQITAAEKMNAQITKAITKATDNYAKVESGKLSATEAFGAANAQISQATATLQSSQSELDKGYTTFKDSSKKALEAANANQLLSLETLSGIIKAQNFSMPAGYIEGAKGQYLLKVDDEFKSSKSIENMVLTNIDGAGDIRLSDVADVSIVNNSDETYAKVNGRDAVVLAVYKASTAGTAAVSDRIGDAMKSMEDSDKGLQFLKLMDQGDYIDLVINSVFSNLIAGALLAFLVLLLFLKDIRPTAVVALSIPLSVIAALLIMYFTGITLNVISLSGLALGIGMLVDNSIVVMENIYRLKTQGVSAARAAVMGANQVAGAIFASTLTTICVFLPIVFTDGLSRQLMQDMCLTIAYSLVASLVIAMTVIPSLSSTLLRNSRPKEHKHFARLLTKYEAALRFCLRRKYIPIILALVLLVICVGRVFSTGIVMMPEMGSTQLSMSVTTNSDQEITDSYQLLDDISTEVKKIKGVETVGSIQSSSLGMGQTDSHSFTAMVLLEEKYAEDNKKIAKKIEKILETKDCKDYQVMASNMDTSSLMGSGLQVDITGDDEAQLLTLSRRVMKLVEKEKGFTDVTNGQDTDTKELVLHVNKNKAMAKGLTVAEIYQALSQKLTADKTATKVTLHQDALDVVLSDQRKPLTKENLLNFKISANRTEADGTQTTKEYKLKEFASFRERDSVSSIQHNNGSKIISVTATTKDGYNTTLLSRKMSSQLKKIDKPKGYDIKISGEKENVDKMVRDMLLMMLVAVILIYLIMLAQFANFLSPFIVMFTIPLAFTGGFLALMVTGEPLSILSMMGFLILSGVVVNNGIVFIDYANQLRRAGMEKRDALVQTGKDRIRPILMTALTTVLSMSVMALSHSQGAEMGRGMAIVTIGGLLYATLMTLFIVPVLYDLFYRKKDLKVVDLGDESTL